MSFFAVDPARWRRLRERLSKPWEPDEVMIDLRWLQDQVLLGTEEWPGGRKLAKQWGWGHKRVRLLLCKASSWSDPKKLEAWKHLFPEHFPEVIQTDPGHDEDTEEAQAGHDEGTDENADTPPIDDSGHSEGTEGAREGHKKGHTRDPFPQTPPPPPSPSSRSTRARDPGSTGEAGAERSEPQDGPGWATEGAWGLPAERVVELVCRISAAIRERPVRPIEAATDSGHVAAVLALDPDRGLEVLAEEAELVARWGRDAPEGRDDLGGVRANGERWGMDRSRRVGSVLDPRKWPDRLPAAQRWLASGARADPPRFSRGDHPARLKSSATMTPEELAEARQILDSWNDPPTAETK